MSFRDKVSRHTLAFLIDGLPTKTTRLEEEAASGQTKGGKKDLNNLEKMRRASSSSASSDGDEIN